MDGMAVQTCYICFKMRTDKSTVMDVKEAVMKSKRIQYIEIL